MQCANATAEDESAQAAATVAGGERGRGALTVVVVR